MAAPLLITIKVNGGIFEKDVQKAVRDALYEEAILKVDQRLTRAGARGSGGKGKGVIRNTVTHDPQPADLQTTVSSTNIWPRTRGTAWQRKNVGITKAMVGNVLRKAADRIVAEMGA